MPAVTRQGVDPSAGHCFSPRPADQGSGDVITNGQPTVRVTDHYPTHTCGTSSHDGAAASGSPTVIVNGLQIHRIGDDINCGDTSASGSPNVFAGDQSFSTTPMNIPPDPKPIPLTVAEKEHIVTSAPATKADPVNQAAGVTAPEAPMRENAETVGTAPEGGGCWGQLNDILKTAMTKDWKENGSNQNIVPCYAAVGCPSNTDSVAWCAAFAGAMLKASGLPYKKSLSSLNYQGYGTPVPINDPTKWRKNDIIVFKRTGGGHVGFIQAVAPSQNKVSVLGGNQSDNLTISNFGPSYFSNIVYIGRPCPEIPPTADVPIVMASLGGVGRGAVKVT